MRRLVLIALLPIYAGLLWVAWQFDPPIFDFAFSADGKRLRALSGVYDFTPKGTAIPSGAVIEWDLESERPRILIHLGDVEAWDFSADGSKLAIRDAENRYRVFDLDSGKLINQWPETESLTYRGDLYVTCDGQAVVSTQVDMNSRPIPVTKVFHCWDPTAGRKSTIQFSGGGTMGITKAGCSQIFVYQELNVATLYDVRSTGLVRIRDLDLSSDNSTKRPWIFPAPDGSVYLSHDGRRADVIDLTTNQAVARIQIPNVLMQGEPIWSRDATLLAAKVYSPHGDDLFVFNARDGTLLSRVRLPLRMVISQGSTFSPDGRRFIKTYVDGKIHVVDWAAKTIDTIPDRRPFTAVLAGFAGVLAALWIATSHKLPSSRPLLDLTLIHALLGGPLFVYLLVHSPHGLFLGSLLPCLGLAHVASLAGLVAFWWIHGRVRWSVRMTGAITGAAAMCAILFVVLKYRRDSWDVLIGSISFLGLLLLLFAIQRSCAIRLSRTGEMSAKEPENRVYQWPLRDVFLLVTAVAAFVGVLRYVRPQAVSAEGVTFVSVNGLTLAAACFIGAWSALGTSRWWLRIGVLTIMPPLLGFGLAFGFRHLHIFDPWWYVNLHATAAMVVFTSLLIFRLNGYRLQRE